MSLCCFRPARETDREAVLSLARETPCSAGLTGALWECWLADEEGEITVGEVDGELIALGKVTVVGAREGWLELQQIAQAHRQQGLTLALTAYQADRAQKVELRVLRWAVSSANTAGQRVAAKVGFHRVAVWGPSISEHLGAGAPDLSVLEERHYSAILNWLGWSSILRASGGLFAQGGSWQELTGKKMRSLLAASQVVGLTGDNGGVAAFAILSTGVSGCVGAGAAGECQVGYVDGEWKSLLQLALALRGHAGRDAQAKIRVMLTGEPTLRGIFQAAGFQEDPESRDLWIFERLLA
ncbi:MAG: GNAT family N-acetyltransferase [Chloroflexota bacterium]|nr:GNAT family N-acetyltransferase [Chloroflexota bacterium]